MKIVVIGAGLAGLMAARRLHDAGHEVTVLDKGRGVGGRLATRRIGEARFDHGAQFFTVRTDEFRGHVAKWIAEGVVREWCRGFGEDDGHPRYVGTDGMTSIAKHLARGIDVRTDRLVFTLKRNGEDDGVTVVTDDAVEHRADAVILTAPVPQSYSLLMGLGIELPQEMRGGEYERTIALLAVLDSDDHRVPAPGGLQNPHPDFQFIGDNMAKGISPVPALTFHFSPAFSTEHWDDDPDELRALLHARVAPWLGRAAITDGQVKKWRLATPTAIHPERCWKSSEARVIVAGDMCAGPRVEAAALSGLAAADSLR